MTPRKELKPGDRFGEWELLEEMPQKRGVRVWKCRCSCGTIKPIQQSSLTTGNSKSCGCKKAPRSHNDLAGKKFGQLTVIRKLDERMGGRIAWKCKCDCGNYRNVKGVYLTSGQTKSCGCLKKKQDKINFRDKYDEQYKENVNTSLLTSKKRSDNKSGVKGVSYHKSSDRWVAHIGYGGKQIRLGYFKDIRDAINARQKAEEKYHKPYLEDDTDDKH